MYKTYEKPLVYLKNLRKLYEETTGKNFSNLIPLAVNHNKENPNKKKLSVVDYALFELLDGDLYDATSELIVSEKEQGVPMLKLMGKYFIPDMRNIDLTRKVEDFSIEDILNIHNCLEYSQYDEYMLIHYNEIGVWTNPCVPGTVDRWSIYDKFLSECRSLVINVNTMKIIALPFSKFRNLNECEEYSMENILKRLEKAKSIEYSDKLDGSMIQMVYVEDERFYNNVLVSTSGTIVNGFAPQLGAVIDFLKNTDKKYIDLVKDYQGETCIFEWIHKSDRHVVVYPEEMFGLHLIGMRNIKTGEIKRYKEIIQIAKDYYLPCTTLYDEDLDSVLGKLDDFKATEKEGYVLNVDGFLVKIKCNDFVGMMRLFQEASSFNTIIRHVANGTIDDILSKIPLEYHDMVNEKVQTAYDFETRLRGVIKDYYSKIPNDISIKDAMLYIKKEVPKRLQGYVRNMYLDQDFSVFGKYFDTKCPSYIKQRDIIDWNKYLDELENK